MTPAQLENLYRGIYAGPSVCSWKNRLFPPALPPVYKFPGEVGPSEEEIAKEPESVARVIGEEIYERVICAAKDHGITVHCVLLIAGVRTLGRTAETARIKLPESFKHVWTVETRKLIDYKFPQPLGYFSGAGMANHKCVSKDTLDK